MEIKNNVLEKVYDIDIKKETFEIPDNVNIIKNGCCSNLNKLKKIIISKDIEKIERYAFDTCIGLKEVEILNENCKMDYAIFCNCLSLEKIILPQKIEKLETALFWNCKQLKNIQIPNTVISIGIHTFYNCLSLEEILIPNNVKILTISSFLNCKNLKKIHWKNKIYSYNDLVEYGEFKE